MKNLLFILILAPTIAMMPTDFIGMTEISNAISKGDIETLSKYFDDNVEVAVLDEEDVYDKSEAKSVVNDFFTKYRPKSFNQVHKGTSKGQDSQYLIGNLSAGGTTFRVYLYMKVEGSKFIIQELRFDKE